MRTARAVVWLLCAAVAMFVARPYYLAYADARLTAAIKSGSAPGVSQWLRLGADPNGRRSGPVVAAWPPLSEAAQHGNIDILRILLRHGARANNHAPGDWTALMFAAQVHSSEEVRLLLDNGADVNASDDQGTTSLMAGAGDSDIVRMLLAAT